MKKIKFLSFAFFVSVILFFSVGALHFTAKDSSTIYSYSSVQAIPGANNSEITSVTNTNVSHNSATFSYEIKVGNGESIKEVDLMSDTSGDSPLDIVTDGKTKGTLEAKNLDPGTKYDDWYVVATINREAGQSYSTDQYPITSFETSSSVNIIIWVSVTVGLILILVVLLITLIFIKKHNRKISEKMERALRFGGF